MDIATLYPLILFILASLIIHMLVCAAASAFEQLKDIAVDFSGVPATRAQRIQNMLEESGAVLLSLNAAIYMSSTLFVALTVIFALRVAEIVAVSWLFAIAASVVLLATIEALIREVWSKRYAASKSLGYIEVISLPLALYAALSSPLSTRVAALLNKLSTRLAPNGNGLRHQKILAIVEDPEDSGLEENERAMIHSIMEFGETEVHEIMIPRTDMVCIDENTDLNTLNQIIEEKGHSRFPLYAEDVDHILGIVHVKDLLGTGDGNRSSELCLRDLAREALFVPETKRLDDLLKEFQKEKHHMAIVVDEYGGTAGLVTLEDVIEEIIGDIQDEYDKEQPLVQQIAEGEWRIDAKIDLHELNETIGVELPTEGDYESLGGLILSETGYVPKENEIVEYGDYDFLIEKVVRNRIVCVKMSLKENQPQTEEQKKPDLD